MYALERNGLVHDILKARAKLLGNLNDVLPNNLGLLAVVVGHAFH